MTDLLNEHPLLTNYAMIILLMFLSAKQLSKVIGDITYSWKMFLSIFESIIMKIVRDLNQNNGGLGANLKKDVNGSMGVKNSKLMQNSSQCKTS